MTMQEKLEAVKTRSAWSKGVKLYALELLENVEETAKYTDIPMEELVKSYSLFRQAALNGAADWKEYSWGGSSLAYNHEIAERLCNPTELKRTDGGARRPNSREEWLDVQARALWQAFHLLNSLR